MNRQQAIVIGGIGEKKSNKGTQYYMQDRIYKGTVAVSITTSYHPWYLIGGKVKERKIRKLTPKECWRLMGFEDKDIDQCINAGLSNTQLYKQAGNSIVVDILQAILQNLLMEG